MADKWSPTTPWFGGNKETKANWPTWVCRNPRCKSVGKSHPNCHCGAPSFSQQSKNLEYAKGGAVFCDSSSAHEPGCEFYAEGGPVSAPEMPAPLPQGQGDDPQATLGHAAIEHGLRGFLEGSVGDPFMREPEKSAKLMDEAKAQHRFRQLGVPADGLEESAPKKTQGTRFGDSVFEGKHHESAESMQDHPLVGSVAKGTLGPILQRLSGPMLEKETNPEAFRGSVDYLHSAARGGKRMSDEIKKLMEQGVPPTHLQEMSKESDRKELHERIESVMANPEQLLDISGSLGHYLPDHSTQMAATAAQAAHYLNNLRPKQIQTNPLDPVSKPDPLAQDSYNRQLDIANQPLRVLHHIKDGTLHPQDMVTLQTIYPGLHKAMVSEINNEIINAKAEGRDIPYKHRMALSLAIGQPLDGTLTSDAMMAIIASAGGPEDQASKGPTAQTQKTIEKATAMYQTPDEQRQLKP